jgi:RND family efflux transporter MFP subunit
VARPVERLVTAYEVFTARTQAVQSVDVKARVTGYLMKIDFKDGDPVKEGQVLFEIDIRPYKAALDKAKADLETARAAQVKAQAFYDIGLNVQKESASAISVQEIDKRRGQRDETVGQVKQALANLETAQLNYDWCKVTAPISGLATRHFVDVGNLVNQDTTILTNIVSLKPVWAYFDVDQNTVESVQRLVREGKIKSPRTTEIPVQMGLDTLKGFPISGVIDFVSNQLDPRTGSIQVRAVFPNEDGTLAAGLFARIKVPISDEHQALLVNERAIGTSQGQSYILVLNDKNEVEDHSVAVGQAYDGLREVLRTREIRETTPQGKEVIKQVEVLKPSDRIIVNGLQRVRPGMVVKPKLVNMVTGLPETGGDSKPPSPVTPK